MERNKLFKWFPRWLSLFIVIYWIAAVTLSYRFDQSFMLGLSIWLILVLTTAISWKDELIGGIFFCLIGFTYLIFATSDLVSFFGAAPFFVVGGLFMHHYFYEEKNESLSGDW